MADEVTIPNGLQHLIVNNIIVNLFFVFKNA